MVFNGRFRKRFIKPYVEELKMKCIHIIISIAFYNKFSTLSFFIIFTFQTIFIEKLQIFKIGVFGAKIGVSKFFRPNISLLGSYGPLGP